MPIAPKSQGSKSADNYRGGWSRLYALDLDDEVIQCMPDNLFKLYYNLYMLSDLRRGNLPEMAGIAFRLRSKLHEIEEGVAGLLTRGLLVWADVDGKQVLQIRDWHLKQPKRENSTARVRRFRQRQTSEKNTVQNGVKRDETTRNAFRNGFRNANGTDETYSSLSFLTRNGNSGAGGNAGDGPSQGMISAGGLGHDGADDGHGGDAGSNNRTVKEDTGPARRMKRGRPATDDTTGGDL